MSAYTYVCDDCKNEETVESPLSEGPPDMSGAVCKRCDGSSWQRVWATAGVVWKASGGTRGNISDAQRARGEYVVDRK